MTSTPLHRAAIGAVVAAASALLTLGTAVANATEFDPQPDPPGQTRGFGPQPEPPVRRIDVANPPPGLTPASVAKQVTLNH